MRWSLLAREAAAYLHTGLLLPRRGRVRREGGKDVRRAAIFIPGMGGHGAQFLGFRTHLEPEIQAFTAFEYSSLIHPDRLAVRLQRELEGHAARGRELVIVGHSLGGVLARIALQTADLLPIVAFIAICAPLGGTWRSRMIPGALGALTPDSSFMEGVRCHGHRLDRYQGRILTISVDHDIMLKPPQTAHLPGHASHVFSDLTHNAALLDGRVHELVARFVHTRHLL